ncbi:MAG: 1-(5-phosphoribosyl)-5-[(5-phosphoribosylamino)methylideneamino]imidazole-4-carboxamide isomerase [Pseudomonadota bacterium]
MSLYPAIDLKAGECVRLLHGKMNEATVYNSDPAAQARLFADDGFTRLHIVDLDGAFSGNAENHRAVKAILDTDPKWCQLGGGIRTMQAVEGWLNAGIDRVILGTAAVKDPSFVKAAAKAFPEQVAVGIDAENGRVKIAGWAEDGSADVLEIAKRFEDVGVGAMIYTDITRDGALSGVNVDATAALAESISIPVIASGGVSGVEDIKNLSASPSIEGVIIGRALYDGRLSPIEAVSASKRL